MRTVGEFYATYHRFRDPCFKLLGILMHPDHPLYLKRKKQLLGTLTCLCVFTMTTASGLSPSSLEPQFTHRENINLDKLEYLLEVAAKNDTLFMQYERLRQGDTFSSLFKRLGINDLKAQAFIRTSSEVRQLMTLKSGEVVYCSVDRNNHLKTLKFILPRIDQNNNTIQGDRSNSDSEVSASVSSVFVLERIGADEFQTKLEIQDNHVEHQMRSGVFKGDFFADMDAAEVPDEIVEQVLNIFSGVIDFYHDIQQQDRFRIVYESIYYEGQLIRNGKILAIELINKGKTHQAVWYPTGKTGAYYTFDGRAMKRTFLRAPVEFSRLSSGFGLRMHPIWGGWAQHNGVDFVAPAGTSVFATAEGKVEFVGDRNGYGNLVVLSHLGQYSTYYAHLSAVDSTIKIGQQVKQGQILGQVGATGWATAPHLHYEFRYQNVPVDPLTGVGLNNDFLLGQERQQFARYTAALLKRIYALRSFNGVATINN